MLFEKEKEEDVWKGEESPECVIMGDPEALPSQSPVRPERIGG